MVQVTRWHVVAVTASTAVLAGGALGVTNVLAGPLSTPEPIRLESVDIAARTVQPTDDVLTPTPLSIVSEPTITSATTTGSVTTPVASADSIVSPDGPVTQAPSETTSTPEPASSTEPTSADSPYSPASVDTPSSLDS